MTHDSRLTTSINETVASQQTFFKSGRTKDPEFRKDQLIKLKKILKEHEQEIFDALRDDFQKPPFETYATELGILYNEIDHLVKHISTWTKPVRVWGSLINFPSRNYIYSQPYGVALVIGAWNYPVQLTLNPVLGAMAAGNCVIAKPSELAAHSSALIAKVINNFFDPAYLHVAEGAVETTQALLKQPLDYIFFTGSTRVGKIIMQAAAEQLTPVTLELGGKSPAIVDESADLSVAAKRIAWGKFVNAGQTCVAPDYLYVQKGVRQSLFDQISKELNEFYGPNPEQSPDYPRIINKNHFDRLEKYIDNGRVKIGGDRNADTLYIAPTVLTGITWEHPVMKEEIFGPILPVLEFDDIRNVIEVLNTKPKPLALYIFSRDTDVQQKCIQQIAFGGGCINDTIAHLGNHNLPFGGVGNSGIGSYHGKASFDVFSHKKSIMKKPTWIDIPIRYAPYKDHLKWLKKIVK